MVLPIGLSTVPFLCSPVGSNNHPEYKQRLFVLVEGRELPNKGKGLCLNRMLSENLEDNIKQTEDVKI